MSFNQQTIKTIANLARLKFPEDREEKFMQDLTGILDWVEQLKEVNVDGVEPLVSVSPRQSASAIRTDKVTDGGLQAELMANAPESVQGFYEVPRMVE
ncbi:MAG: Asp-tRNA(Asn)/Glu-tRNA(Gln) amidotransferase subunit GatC [Pseudomonadota bacterium]|nr:Asp-tRNA(Asn)/Glu-tRNA(Gln) amidotransferase subunit GatC [Pseudomonadota bacterium]